MNSFMKKTCRQAWFLFEPTADKIWDSITYNVIDVFLSLCLYKFSKDFLVDPGNFHKIRI